MSDGRMVVTNDMVLKTARRIWDDKYKRGDFDNRRFNGDKDVLHHIKQVRNVLEIALEKIQ